MRITPANAECVVTGVAGFVGSHLAEKLLTLGCRVIGIDNFFSGRKENLESFRTHPAFVFYERAITEPTLLDDLQKSHPGISHVFHLAAVVSVPYSMEHSEETDAVNHLAACRLLHDAERLDMVRFVFAGSAAEYGDDTRLPLREEFATRATRHVSPYGRSKFLATEAVRSSPIGVALRFFNIYGPRQDPRSPYSGVISRFVDRALAAESLTIYGDGLQSRDFVFVDDVVEAYFRAGGLVEGVSDIPPGVYNIATGRSVTILELAETLCRLTGSRKLPVFAPERPGDIRFSGASVEAFERVASWKPRTGLADGLERTLLWAKSRRALNSEERAVNGKG